MNKPLIAVPTKIGLTTAQHSSAVETSGKLMRAQDLLCVGDDKLDYRSAWETDAPDQTTESQGTITCDGKVYQLTPGKTVFDYADDLAVQVPYLLLPNRSVPRMYR